MANLDATDWNDIQLTEASNEKRFSELGLVNLAKDSTAGVDYISPSARQQLNSLSSLRDVKIPVLKDQTITIATQPGFDYIPSNLGTSAAYSFTPVDIFSGFRHYPAQFDNNQMDSEWTKREIMKNVAYKMGNTAEGLLATVLETRKTQVVNFLTQVSQGDGAFTFATNILKVAKAAQKETMFYNLEQLMAANELGGNYRIATNRAGLAVQKSEAAKYGADNTKNLQALGMLPADRMYESGNIAPSTQVFNGWLVRDGGIGMIENFPFDFRNGTEVGGKKWSISDMEIPYTRLRANIYVNNEATEATALVGAGTDSNMIMTHFQEMAIWIRFYIVYRYNSDLTTYANDVVKIQGLTT